MHINVSRFEVLAEIEKDLGPGPAMLKSVEKSWQPADFVPDMGKPDWQDAVATLQQTAREVPAELFLVLIGDMITEEALPSYQSWLTRFEETRDHTGDSDRPWAKWIRGWSAEENRHGDLLNRWLYLSGRADMRAIEGTIQRLIRDGFNPETQNDPYQGFVYTAFQERATRISHGNVGKLARSAGDGSLLRICTAIATDEARHEESYKMFVQRALELDPNGVLPAMAAVLQQQVVMPARLMVDPEQNDIFKSFAAVAEAMGVYTSRDYLSILEHLVEFWKLESLGQLNDDAEKARDYLCRLPARYARLVERRRPPRPEEHSKVLCKLWLKD